MTTTRLNKRRRIGAYRSYLVLSDIHLGARSTSAEEILQHLTAFFDNFSATSALTKIDVLFIAGDLWDDTLQLNSKVLDVFLPWLKRLVDWCVRHEVKLRILEGTPRHDRLQGKPVSAIVGLMNAALDYRYITELSIERIEDLDLSILYVPDECHVSAKLTQDAAERLLAEQHLPCVDIAIMHGMFKYQLGDIPMNAKVHSEDWYLQHVKHYISIGHIHMHSQYERIVAQGSFDRLNHGEESPKGAVLIEEYQPGVWRHQFLENPLAKKYVTIKVRGDVEAALKKIASKVRPLPNGSYVRIESKEGAAIFSAFDTLKRQYPFLTFSKKIDHEVIAVSEHKNDRYIPIILNENTIVPAIMAELSALKDPTLDLVKTEDRLNQLLGEPTSSRNRS